MLSQLDFIRAEFSSGQERVNLISLYQGGKELTGRYMTRVNGCLNRVVKDIIVIQHETFF